MPRLQISASFLISTLTLTLQTTDFEAGFLQELNAQIIYLNLVQTCVASTKKILQDKRKNSHRQDQLFPYFYFNPNFTNPWRTDSFVPVKQIFTTTGIWRMLDQETRSKLDNLPESSPNVRRKQSNRVNPQARRRFYHIRESIVIVRSNSRLLSTKKRKA